MTPLQFPLNQPRLSRRGFIQASGSLALAALASSCARTGGVKRQISFADYPFKLGVASGDPDHESVVLWTRLAPKPLEFGGMPPEAVEVSWQIAEDEGMKKVVRKGVKVARPEWAHSVHVEAGGLQPDRWYYYQFKAGNEVSPVGRTRTLPHRATMANQVRFAFVSCQHYESGLFTAYEHMLKEEVDLVVHLGDYIYEGAGRDGGVRKHFGPELMTLDDYRHRYSQYRSDPALHRMHAAAPWFVTWDDHEVDNNYAADISEQANVTREQFLARRAAAYQAYYENMPLRRTSIPNGPDMRLYRRAHFGRLADFHVLDTRQYRTDQPCGDKNGPQCPEALDEKATLLGHSQRDWLLDGLERSRSRWNVLAQQVMMAKVDRVVDEPVAYSMDQWPGYEMERQKLIRSFRDRKVSNPVVLTGDIHTNWANELSPDFERPDAPPTAAEFVGTSLSSSGDGTANPRNLDKLLAENPMVKWHNAERGYVLCTVTPETWRSDYRTVPYVTRPGAPIVTRATWMLESGSSKLHKG